MSYFEELTKENREEQFDANLEEIAASITTEDAMDAASSMTALEFRMEETLTNYEKAEGQAEVLAEMNTMVTEDYSDKVADMYALSMTLLCRANGIPDATFGDAMDSLTTESSEDKKEKSAGTVAKIKKFAKNVYASLKIVVTKFVGFLRKWVGKALIVLLKGDEKRKEIAKKINEMDDKDIEGKQLPQSMLSKAMNFVKSGDKTVSTANSSALFTFNTSVTKLGADDFGAKALDYSKVKGSLEKEVKGAKDSALCVYVGRGVYAVSVDGVVKTASIKKADMKLTAGSTIGDSNIDVKAVVTALETSKKDLQKAINDKYEAGIKAAKASMEVVKGSEDASEIAIAKKNVNVMLKLAFQAVSGVANGAKDALAVGKIIAGDTEVTTKEVETKDDEGKTTTKTETKVETKAASNEAKVKPAEDKELTKAIDNLGMSKVAGVAVTKLYTVTAAKIKEDGFIFKPGALYKVKGDVKSKDLNGAKVSSVGGINYAYKA